MDYPSRDVMVEEKTSYMGLVGIDPLVNQNNPVNYVENVEISNTGGLSTPAAGIANTQR